MATADRSSFLDIPGAWISKELDLDLSLPAPSTPPPSKPTAYIRASRKESPTFPLPCDPPPSSIAPIIHSTPRAACRTLSLGKGDHRVEGATFTMPIGSKTVVEASPQSVLSLLDGALDSSNAYISSPVGPVGASPLPTEPTRKLTGDTPSIHSGVTGLSLELPGSPLSKCNSDFGFATVQEDMACMGFASQVSLNCSVIDVHPSSASISFVPSISSIASDLQLHNLPTPDEEPPERHSAYFSAVSDEISLSQRSDEGVGPVHETSTSSGSALDLCVPSAEEAHQQILWQENPAPRRPTVRIEVRNNIFETREAGTMSRETFTYACESLPYDAGFRPHAYVDNHEYTTHAKHHLEALAEDQYAMEDFMEEEDHATDRSRRPTIIRRLVGGKKMSKLIAFGSRRFQKPPHRFSVDSRAGSSQSAALSSSMTNIVNRNPGALGSDNPSNLSDPSATLTTSSPPPPYTIPHKEKYRNMFSKTWTGPRPLSMFVIPKPGVEGKLVPSPKELPMCLPVDESPRPLSPAASPQVQHAQTPEADVHGRSYGPSRVASLDIPSKTPDPSNLSRKERRSWLTGNARSPKNSPLVV